MGMILGHKIPGAAAAAAAPGCAYQVSFNGASIDNFSTPGGNRYDAHFRPDGLRAWTFWSVTSFGYQLHQYDAPAGPWNFSVTPWTKTGGFNGPSGSLNRSIEWHDNGNKLTILTRWFSGFRRMDTYDQSATPWDIGFGGLGPVFASYTGLIGNEFHHEFSLDGMHVFVQRSIGSQSEIRRYNMTVAHDISTITGFDQLWIAPFTYPIGVTDTWRFSTDHTKLYFVTQVFDELGSVDLTAPDDISAPFNIVTGVSTNLPSNLQVARGMAIRPDNGDIILMQDQNAQQTRVWSGVSVPATDPDFANVVLLLDFAGNAGDTNIRDLSNSDHPDTFIGNAQVNVAVRYLGQNSVDLLLSGDRVSFPDSNDWDFGTGDFTIEFGLRATDLTGTKGMIGNWNNLATDGWFVRFDNGSLEMIDAAGTLFSEPWTPSINTWHHVAISRQGTAIRGFLDGVQVGPTGTDSTNVTGGTQALALGGINDNNQPMTGYLGGVRITKNIARYTANFTPPACFYPHPPVGPETHSASGAPSIAKPTSAGAATVTSPLLWDAGVPLIGSGVSPQTIPAPASEAAGDTLFVYGSNEIPNVDGTWTQLATAPTSFYVFTKVAAGDATDLAQSQGSGVGHAVFVKWCVKDDGSIGPGVWDFDAQSTLRNTFRTAFDVNSLTFFGPVGDPSFSFYAGLRIGSGTQPGTVGDFSNPVFNAPPNGGTILKVKTQQAAAPNNTYWSAVSVHWQQPKAAYPTGDKWTGANEPTSHLTQTRGWRYDHDT